MTSTPFQVVPLNHEHDRASFTSGTESLDGYFRQHVSQDIRRRVTACFVALSEEQRIAGFYTLASTSVLLNDLPEPLGKKLPRYPLLPAVRMGRLAVDLNFRGIGLGGALLADAFTRTLRSEIAAYALVVDAKDDSAAAFYRHHGMIPFSNQPLTLFLPLATARKITGIRRSG